MTEIQFEQQSPKGTATIDTARVLIGLDGAVREFTGPISDMRIVPVVGERLAALEAHFGATWRDAIAAVKALAG